MPSGEIAPVLLQRSRCTAAPAKGSVSRGQDCEGASPQAGASDFSSLVYWITYIPPRFPGQAPELSTKSGPRGPAPEEPAQVKG